MSLEYAIEQYPVEHRLKNGSTCVVRPLLKTDAGRLQKFLMAVPEVERLYLKHPVGDLAYFQRYCRQIDFAAEFPLLMLDGKAIIGQATLHQRAGGWKRHIGLVRVLRHPQYLGLDVAKTLMNEIVSVARHAGLVRLETELNGERKRALRAMEQLGFRQLVRLPDYIVDMQRQAHDYILMALELATDEEYAAAG